MHQLPTIQITFDHDGRCWQVVSPALSAPLLFASRGRGAVGLIGALGTTVFTHRDTGGRIEISFAGETISLLFEGTGNRDLIG